MKLDLLKKKKVLILGLGREGESSFRFLRKLFPKKTILLADKRNFNELAPEIQKIIKKDKNIESYLGKSYLKSIQFSQIILRTPGISRKELNKKVSKKQIITSQTEIFLEKYRNKTIGITGTKGKGTTATLIYKILKQGGKKVELIGNIGKPVLNYFLKGDKTDFFIFEMSAHQLEDIKISPHVAVFLNLCPAHLDHFGTSKKYYQAKANIALWQKKNDIFIFNNDYSQIKDLAKKKKTKKINFGQDNNNDYFFDKENIYYKKQLILKRSDIKLKGDHFINDIMATMAVGKICHIPFIDSKKTIIKFKNLEHCLEYIGKIKKINFYDDSFASEPIATINAINTVKRIGTIILGGFDRGLNFKALSQAIIKNGIKTIILFPPAGKRIRDLIIKNTNSKNRPLFFEATTMKEAVNLCFKHTREEESCLLSPACASFGIFKDYKDRGEQFKKYVFQKK